MAVSGGDDLPDLSTLAIEKDPIVNFPLPRELRDEIYGYLVDVDRVEKTTEKVNLRYMTAYTPLRST